MLAGEGQRPHTGSMQRVHCAAAMAALKQTIATRMDELRLAQRSTQEGAVHPEARAENSKDTRATEASYLARGLAKRTEELANVQRRLDSLSSPHEVDEVAVPSLVCVRSERAGGDDEDEHYLVVPAGGGTRFALHGTSVLAITPASPLGRALLGLMVGDELPSAVSPDGLRVVVSIS